MVPSSDEAVVEAKGTSGIVVAENTVEGPAGRALRPSAASGAPARRRWGGPSGSCYGRGNWIVAEEVAGAGDGHAAAEEERVEVVVVAGEERNTGVTTEAERGEPPSRPRSSSCWHPETAPTIWTARWAGVPLR